MMGVNPDSPLHNSTGVLLGFSKEILYALSSPSSSTFCAPGSPVATRISSLCDGSADDSLHKCLSDADRCAHELATSVLVPVLSCLSVQYHGKLQRRLPA